MKKAITFVLVSAAFLLVASSAHAISISISLADQEGKALKDANCAVVGDNEKVELGRTDDNGKMTVNSVEPNEGKFHVHCKDQSGKNMAAKVVASDASSGQTTKLAAADLFSLHVSF